MTEKINLTRQEMQKFADDVANQKMLDTLRGYLDELTSQKLDLEVQDRITGAKADEAWQEYQDALAAWEEAKNMSLWEDFSNAWDFNPDTKSILDYEFAAEEALKAYEKLVESQLAVQETITNVDAELEIAQGVYDSYVQEMQAIAEDAAKAGEEVGKAFADGMITGMEVKQVDLRRSAVELGNIPPQTVSEVQQIASPSKVAKRLGGFFGEGLAVGLSESEEEVARAAASLAGKFDISGALADEYRRAQSEISSMRSLGDSGGRIDFDAYSNQMREMNRSAAASAAYASGMNRSEREANITIIQQLDGREISREVSRVQFNDTKITARARGVR